MKWILVVVLVHNVYALSVLNEYALPTVVKVGGADFDFGTRREGCFAGPTATREAAVDCINIDTGSMRAVATTANVGASTGVDTVSRSFHVEYPFGVVCTAALSDQDFWTQAGKTYVDAAYVVDLNASTMEPRVRLKGGTNKDTTLGVGACEVLWGQAPQNDRVIMGRNSINTGESFALFYIADIEDCGAKCADPGSLGVNLWLAEWTDFESNLGGSAGEVQTSAVDGGYVYFSFGAGAIQRKSLSDLQGVGEETLYVGAGIYTVILFGTDAVYLATRGGMALKLNRNGSPDWTQWTVFSGVFFSPRGGINAAVLDASEENIFFVTTAGGVHRVKTMDMSLVESFDLSSYAGEALSLQAVAVDNAALQLWVAGQSQDLTIISNKTVWKMDIVDCTMYGNTCTQCTEALDMYCGWCPELEGCSEQSACPATFYTVNCPVVTPVTKSSPIQGGDILQVAVTNADRPGQFSCVFLWTALTNTSVNGTVSNGFVECLIPPSNTSQAGEVDVELHYEGILFTNGAIKVNYFDCVDLSTCILCSGYQSCEWCGETDGCMFHSESCVVEACVNNLEGDTIVIDGNTNGGNSSAGIGIGAGLAGAALLVVAAVWFKRGRGDESLKVPQPVELTPIVRSSLMFGAPKPHSEADQAKANSVAIKSLQALIVDDPSGDILEALTNSCQITEMSALAKSLVFLFESRENQAERLILHLVRREVEHATSQGTLFRQNSLATKCFGVFCRMHGLDYVHNTLGEPINRALFDAANTAEVDPRRLKEGEDALVNRHTLAATSQRLFGAIAKSADDVPVPLCRIMHQTRKIVSERWPIREDDMAQVVALQLQSAIDGSGAALQEGGRQAELLEELREILADTKDPSDLPGRLAGMKGRVEAFSTVASTLIGEASTLVEAYRDLSNEGANGRELIKKAERDQLSVSVNGFFFLRFMVPAITAPESWGLVKQPPEGGRRLLVLLAKVIQNLGNNKYFGGKEAYMSQLNAFITDNIQSVNNLFLKIVERGSNAVAFDDLIDIPEEHLSEQLIAMWKLLSTKKGKMLDHLREARPGDTVKDKHRRAQLASAFAHVAGELEAEGDEVAEASRRTGSSNRWRESGVKMVPVQVAEETGGSEDALLTEQ